MNSKSGQKSQELNTDQPNKLAIMAVQKTHQAYSFRVDHQAQKRERTTTHEICRSLRPRGHPLCLEFGNRQPISLQTEWETSPSSCPISYGLQYTHFMEIGQSKLSRGKLRGGSQWGKNPIYWGYFLFPKGLDFVHLANTTSWKE